MRISMIVIGLLLIGSMAVGYYEFIDVLGSDSAYNTEVDDQYRTAFDKTVELSNKINESYSTVYSDNWGLNLDTFTHLIPQALSLVKNVITLPFQVLVDLVESVVTFLNLPAWTKTLMVALIPTILIFGLIALILRFKDT